MSGLKGQYRADIYDGDAGLLATEYFEAWLDASAAREAVRILHRASASMPAELVELYRPGAAACTWTCMATFGVTP